MTYSIIIQLIVSGLALGFIYALVAIEYTLIFNSTGLLNFSHDKFIMLGAYIFAAQFLMRMGTNPVAGVLATVLPCLYLVFWWPPGFLILFVI